MPMYDVTMDSMLSMCWLPMATKAATFFSCTAWQINSRLVFVSFVSNKATWARRRGGRPHSRRSRPPVSLIRNPSRFVELMAASSAPRYRGKPGFSNRPPMYSTPPEVPAGSANAAAWGLAVARGAGGARRAAGVGPAMTPLARPSRVPPPQSEGGPIPPPGPGGRGGPWSPNPSSNRPRASSKCRQARRHSSPPPPAPRPQHTPRPRAPQWAGVGGAGRGQEQRGAGVHVGVGEDWVCSRVGSGVAVDRKGGVFMV